MNRSTVLTSRKSGHLIEGVNHGQELLRPCSAGVDLGLDRPRAAASAPTALSAQPGDGQAELTWADPSDNTISAYSVRYATDEAALSDSPSPEWNVIAGSGTTTVRHVVPNLANGTRYYFQIRAAAGDRSSGPSNTATTQLATSPAAAVTIGDANLRQQLETVMGKTAGATITQLDMAQLIHFSAWNARIAGGRVGSRRQLGESRPQRQPHLERDPARAPNGAGRGHAGQQPHLEHRCPGAVEVALVISGSATTASPM